MPDFEVGKCPLQSVVCKGLQRLSGDQAREYLGPFYKPHATAVVCFYYRVVGSEHWVADCHGKVQGNVSTTEDVPA